MKTVVRDGVCAEGDQCPRWLCLKCNRHFLVSPEHECIRLVASAKGPTEAQRAAHRMRALRHYYAKELERYFSGQPLPSRARKRTGAAGAA
jgi:hypothetical protein